jgi:glucose/mannose transport system substrate-binding protein
LELDEEALTSDTMIKVFDEMREIRGFVDSNFSGRDWNLAMAMVLNGEAAMQLMGDWAKGEMVKAGVQPGVDILCVPAPGTDGSFLFNTDFFAAFKVGEDKQPAQNALASSIMAKEFQEAFNLVKGSIPARTDVPGDKFDACGQKSMADIKAAEKSGTLMGSLAHGHAQPAAVQRAIFDVVTQHFNSDMSSQDAVEELQIAVESANF